MCVILCVFCVTDYWKLCAMFTCQSICLSSIIQLSAILTKDLDKAKWYIHNMHMTTESHSKHLRGGKRQLHFFSLPTRGRGYIEYILLQVYVFLKD